MLNCTKKKTKNAVRSLQVEIRVHSFYQYVLATPTIVPRLSIDIRQAFQYIVSAEYEVTSDVFACNEQRSLADSKVYLSNYSVL